jgi:NAD(P)-dependent dehydrogenase (short-subunit alcohol dehydrogenase family)
MKKLDNEVAVITGGTSGMGLATAKRFVAEGAYVFIMGRRQHALDSAVKDIGTRVTGVQGDIAKLPDLDRLYEIVRAQKGRVDIVFANAGVGEFVTTDAMTEAHFDKTFDVNVKGTLFTVQKALPLFNDGGSIILTDSIATVKGIPAFGVYCASKAAIRSFVRTWTLELKDRKIRANVISPGTIDTQSHEPCRIPSRASRLPTFLRSSSRSSLALSRPSPLPACCSRISNPKALPRRGK